MNGGKKLNIVLAGQANVGKSVIFNYLTGLHQHIGNWPGKTIEKAEGTLFYKDHVIDVVDLPGIYSFSTYSVEELISREYIITQNPDFIINVIDSTHLERNLIFTLQLLELEKPVVIALNMSDLLKQERIEIDFRKLEDILGVPVIPVSAVHGKGITELIDSGLKLIENYSPPENIRLKYGNETEKAVEEISGQINKTINIYPVRWTAVKLLEGDSEIIKECEKENITAIRNANSLAEDLKRIHGHDASVLIADERCNIVFKITCEVMKILPSKKISFRDRFDSISSDKIWGYPVMIIMLILVFLFIFKFGDFLSGIIEIPYKNLQATIANSVGTSFPASLVTSAFDSILALILIALPYILPFYFVLHFLENWGYLSRVAFLSDSLMHKLGVHGKACFPILLGFGCNVPACLSCRIMETHRERFLTALLSVFVPCSAVSVIIMGLVGKFVGMEWAIGLYFLAVIVIFAVGKIASKIITGEPMELIMEMPDYKSPSLKTIIFLTWYRLKNFVYSAAPIIIISGIIIGAIHSAGWSNYISDFLKPVTVNWLGLPLYTGILLIFGFLRKELILLMLAALAGTMNFNEVLTPVQMLTLAIVSMFYIPCVATITALKKEFGWKKALGITVFKIVFAIILAGIISRILTFFMN